MDLLTFIIKYKFIIIFYIALGLLFYIKRKDVQRQAKIIFLLRTKWGLKWMDKFSSKYREWIILLGYIGVGAGFVGLVLISVILIKNLIDLVTKPAAVNGVSLVLPGVNVPGLGVLPFWYWLIAIFIIATVHEFSHGIVARAHNIKVKKTGIVLFGPIIGAFVEPKEEQLRKQSDIKQYSVLAAGAFSNIILAIIALLILNLATFPIQQTMVEPSGFSFNNYFSKNYPFEKAGIEPGEKIIGYNNNKISKFEDLEKELYILNPGDQLLIKTEKDEYDITLVENPDIPNKAFLGISNVKNEFNLKKEYNIGYKSWIYYSVNWINGFLRWLFILSLGIGLFNLLPLPIVDGGRMSQVFLQKLKGTEKGNKVYSKVSMFFLIILLLNLIYPLFIKIFI